MKAAAAYIIQADEATQKSLGALMPHMLDVNIRKYHYLSCCIFIVIFFYSPYLPLLLLVMIKLLLMVWSF